MPLPNILEFIGNNVTQAGFKAAQEKLLNFLSGEAATKVELSAAVTPKADKTYVDNALTSFQNGAIKTYPTLVAANADIANIALNTKVSVLSETDGGDYYKASADATSLTKSPYDPLSQAKIDATTKANNAEANAKTYTDSDKLKIGENASNLKYRINNPVVEVSNTSIINMNGSKSTVTASDYQLGVLISVKKGDRVSASGKMGSLSTSITPYYASALMLDSNRNVISILSTVNGGTIRHQSIDVVAPNDGFIYLRFRATNEETPVYNLYSSSYVSVNSEKILNTLLKSSNGSGIKTDYSNNTEVIESGYIYTPAGAKQSTTSWLAHIIPVKKGDIVDLITIFGSGTANEQMCFIAQLSNAKEFVASLYNYQSAGYREMGLASVEASQDGYLYIRSRNDLGINFQFSLIKYSTQSFISSDPKKIVTDYTNQSQYYVDGSVMYLDGHIVSGLSSWRLYYVPVSTGDTITYNGLLGSNTSGEIIGYIMQCDSSKNWVSTLATYTSTGSSVSGSISATATQTGYLAVRARIDNSSYPVSVKLNSNVSIAYTNDVVKIVSDLLPSNNEVAKVFNAPFHVDLSSLPEKNPNFNTFESPLNYTFRKQWARRDFYNAANSYMLSYMDLTTNPFNYQSNIFDISANNNFSYSYIAGIVKFSNPTANGTTYMFADRYLPFATSELAINQITGNATIGLQFGDVEKLNSVSVRVSDTLVTCEVLVAGVLQLTKTFNVSGMKNCVLQVQNTGRALIIKKIKADGSWSWIGRFVYKSTLDACQIKFLDTWKTYIIAQTSSFTTSDSVQFSGFSNRLASGSNNVSIRFLTYEDGTFIQKGNYLYFLVEGTGTTISDLYTQITRINMNSGEVQMIGAIFQVRTDGVDQGILLGDDSIKAVYDRNSQSWKGISCGMDYNEWLSDSSQRPKLYFETKQDLLQGGIVIIENSIQMKNADGSNFGVGSAYCEDIDFYYDATSSKWVLTGNTISAGCKTFRSPNIYSGITQEYITANVPAAVRDTGNQFVNFNGVMYLTSGGSANKLHLRKYETGLTYLGQLQQDVYLDPTTVGPWCTLVPFSNGDKTELYLLSFDRSDLYEGLTGAGIYDHGGLYCWKASK